MPVIHISETEAANDFAGLMARVRAGEEIVIEANSRPIAILRAVDPPRRSISETIARSEDSSKQLGFTPVMDANFAADMEEIIRNRKPRDLSSRD
jgi:prevent-host-death family protein